MISLTNNKSYNVAVCSLAILNMAWAVLIYAKLAFTRSIWYYAIGYLFEAFFVFDYIVRLVQSKKGTRWSFIRHAILDFFAISSVEPILPFFRIPRLLSLTRLPERIRSSRLFKRVEGSFTSVTLFFTTNGLFHVIYINAFAIIIASVLVYAAERRITFPTFGDAIWWAFVTVTTVGYGDYVPKTVFGRGVAVVLMVVGIGLISMLTGTIATFFTSSRKAKVEEKKDLSALLSIAGDLSDEQLKSVVLYAESIREGEGNQIEQK